MILKATKITKAFGNPPTEIIHPLDLDVAKGEFIAITGRSGSGKSTLLYLLSGLDPITSGEILFSGNSYTSMTEREKITFRNSRLGFVFQFHHLLPEFTALENVLLPLTNRDDERAAVSKAQELLQLVDLSDSAHKLPSQMSGGQCQRTAIARALIKDPDILFADEPTGNLDSQYAENIIQLFSTINREKDTTIVMVTHENDFARRAKRNIHLKDGRIEQDIHNDNAARKKRTKSGNAA